MLSKVCGLRAIFVRYTNCASHLLRLLERRLIDWDDSQTDLAHLGGTAPGAARSGGDRLWEDNWDDDDVEDEFSVQLRYVLSAISCSLKQLVGLPP